MSIHIFIYRLKILLRDREMTFWTIAFPFLLATLFHVVFANLPTGDSFSAIPLAVIDNQDYRSDHGLKTALLAVSGDGERTLFDLQELDMDTAEKLLMENRIAAFITSGNPPLITVNRNGMNQSVVKLFIDSYLQTRAGLIRLMEQQSPTMEIHPVSRSYILHRNAGRNPANEIYIIFFAFTAMCCFYGAFFGLQEALDFKADLSPRAARLGLAPASRSGWILSSTAASLLIHLSTMTLLVLYIQYILGIRIFDRVPLVLLATTAGSLLSISLGMCVGILLKGNENIKSGIITAGTMIGALLAGMYYPGIKYLIEQHFPLLQHLNPPGVLSDAYYSLYFYDTPQHFFSQVAVLFLMAAIGTLIIILKTRKQNYASL